MDLGDIKDVVGIIDRTVGSHSFNGQVEEEPNKKTENEGSTQRPEKSSEREASPKVYSGSERMKNTAER